MEKSGLEPDTITCASVLPALLLGRRIHEYVVRRNLRPNFLLENSLIDMYARCGCLEDAKGVFDRMKFRDVASWTSLISAYGMHDFERYQQQMLESYMLRKDAWSRIYFCKGN
ncbi:hypothetical protein TSUD_189140 [Trifolium subterraneum]|uniref:Pentatricopeptide repeat-containing protein n=1 Tax=Trifolium subterraneum TaxID=3900 RepID=A0A2Z6PP17_TRISU|nr:hypothetical protein TSUD_189140 [Trifolium subterraneum]